MEVIYTLFFLKMPQASPSSLISNLVVGPVNDDILLVRHHLTNLRGQDGLRVTQRSMMHSGTPELLPQLHQPPPENSCRPELGRLCAVRYHSPHHALRSLLRREKVHDVLVAPGADL
jgi:hypothetical protein